VCVPRHLGTATENSRNEALPAFHLRSVVHAEAHWACALVVINVDLFSKSSSAALELSRPGLLAG
jgi:hypothetical protein